MRLGQKDCIKLKQYQKLGGWKIYRSGLEQKPMQSYNHL